MGDLLFDDEEVEPTARPDADDGGSGGGRARRWLLVVGGVIVVLAMLAGLAGLWVQRRIDPPGPPGEEIAFTVPEGATTTAIADLLEEKGIISDAQIFRIYLRIKGGGPFQAGEYALQRNSSMGDVVDVLSDGPTQRYEHLTVPEGLTIAEVAERVGSVEGFSADRFRELLAGGVVRSRYQPPEVSTLEGLLYPDTYTIAETEDEEDLLRRMVELFDQVAAEVGYDQAAALTGRSAYETIIIASLVEAEAKVDADRAKISRVIHNRLEEGMSLGIDATVYYALGRRGGSLTRSDLQVDSPYNTRRYPGMPPTPIAIPGRASLEAALRPEPGPWLYYVLADESGVHAFSEDYNQFLRDKAEAQRKGLI